jgi:signal transduction histidine kinase
LELSQIQRWIEQEKTLVKRTIEEECEKQKKEQAEKNITLAIEWDDTLCYDIEKKHFALLISNLLSNALKYSKNGGTVRIVFNEKKLSITDEWIGINEKDLENIWKRFFRVDKTGKYEWSGIWLSIVERIVKVYSWKIHAESTPQKGTTFHIKVS